jgi:hypothetical protein
MKEEMRELSNKTNTENASDYAAKVWEKEENSVQDIAYVSFIAGARWFASQLAAGMKAIEEGA